jgi:hypothetical protein
MPGDCSYYGRGEAGHESWEFHDWKGCSQSAPAQSEVLLRELRAVDVGLDFEVTDARLFGRWHREIC